MSYIALMIYLIISIACTKINDKEYLTGLDENSEKLDLSFFKLDKFPEKICKMSRLKKLDLSHNSIESLPDNFWKLSNLIELDLSWNKIKVVPVDIKNLKNLKRLILSSNQFDSLPKEIFELDNLEILECSWNNIQSLPENIIQCKNLKHLLIYDNPLLEKDIINLTSIAAKTRIGLFFTLNENKAQYMAGLAYSCQQKKQFTQAVYFYKQSLELNPSDYYVQANLGLLMQNTNQFDLAIKYYDNALKLNPNFSDIYINRGIIKYFQFKSKKEACDDWSKAANLNNQFARNYIQKYCQSN